MYWCRFIGFIRCLVHFLYLKYAWSEAHGSFHTLSLLFCIGLHVHGTCTGTGIATLKAKMSTVVKILTLRNFSQYD